MSEIILPNGKPILTKAGSEEERCIQAAAVFFRSLPHRKECTFPQTDCRCDVALKYAAAFQITSETIRSVFNGNDGQ